jgi:hypothetical protein
MRRVIIAAFVVVAASAAFLGPAAAAMPAPPSQAPYTGCSDWYPQTWGDSYWVFNCTWDDNFSPTDGTGTWMENDYYWDANSSQVFWFATYIIDLDSDWYYSCVIPPGSAGACST